MKHAVAAVLVFVLASEALAQSAAIRDVDVRGAIRDYEALSYPASATHTTPAKRNSLACSGSAN